MKTTRGPIQGVKVVPLKRIPDERGTIFHMLKSTDPHFRKFGEIYFSTVYSGAVKGWHKHGRMTLNYACIYGHVKVVIFDDRKKSKTRGNLMEVFLGPENYFLLIIPPGVWNGFKGMAEPYSIVANCSTHAHKPADSERMDPHRNFIRYDWSRQDG